MSIENQSALKPMHFDSILARQSAWSGSRSRVKKSLSSGLTLTSLVDCFTILVVYLLLATSIGVDELKMNSQIVLPSSRNSEEKSAGVQLQSVNGQYLLDNKPVEYADLYSALKQLKEKNDAIVIIADRKQKYDQLNPLILTSLNAGYSNIRFAVQREEE